MSNTPFAYAVCSVLHRSVEFKAIKRPSLVFVAPLPSSKWSYKSLQRYGTLVTKAILRGGLSFGADGLISLSITSQRACISQPYDAFNPSEPTRHGTANLLVGTFSATLSSGFL